MEAIEQGLEREIVITCNGRPAANLVPLDTMQEGQRLGVAKGLFEVPDIVDAYSAEVAQMFLGVNPPEFPDSSVKGDAPD